MFATKIAIVLRDDLAVWQKLNVTAFLTSGIVAGAPELIGEPYRDRADNVYAALCRQPIVILAADQTTLSQIQQRALTRELAFALYVEEMFTTGHDAANREVFARFAPAEATVVGIGLHAAKNVVDKITQGARLHS